MTDNFIHKIMTPNENHELDTPRQVVGIDQFFKKQVGN